MATLFTTTRFMKGLLFTICFILTSPLLAQEKRYFATATDQEHYTWTLNLIATIHKHHRENAGEIAVFDLGLTQEQIKHLNSLLFVSVYPVEETNPLMLQKFTVDKKGKIARGLYSWKPVVLKQALEMFAEFFYLDSGISLKGPIDPLFEHLHENSYFLIDCGHSVRRMTTRPLVEKFQLKTKANRWILDSYGISAGIQGISRALYGSYIMPTYYLSFHIDNFKDDGSCPKGFGWARHDQTLFSIMARLNNYTVSEGLRKGKVTLRLAQRAIKVRFSDLISITRGQFDLDETRPFLIYKSIEE